MASQEPSVQFDERKDYEKIPKEQSIFDFNFDSPTGNEEYDFEKVIFFFETSC